MNKGLEQWHEGLRREYKARERLKTVHRYQVQDLGDLTKMSRYEAHQRLDEWYDEYEAELKAQRLGDEYDW